MATQEEAFTESRCDAVYYMHRAGEELARKVPDQLSPVAANLGGRTMQLLAGESRGQVRRNLARIFEDGLSEQDTRRMVAGTFRNYARYWYEFFRGPQPEAVASLTYDESELEPLRAVSAERKGGIVCLPHMGNWDLFAAWGASNNIPLTAVAEPAENTRLTDWFVRRREEAGVNIILLGDPEMRPKIFDALEGGRLLVLLSDRDITGNGVEVEFFGEKTKVPAGPALITLGTGAPIIPAATYLEPHNGHSARFFEPIVPEKEDDVATLAQRVTYRLEDSIRQAPDQLFIMQPNWPSDYAEQP